MPPKAATRKAAAPKASAPKRTAATTKAAPKKSTASKPTANGTATTSRKRKAEDDATDSEDKENVPKTKKAKTASKESTTASKKDEPKKAVAKKDASKGAPAKKTPGASKRKPIEDEDEDDVQPKKQKAAPKKRAATPKPAAPPKHPHKIGNPINTAPTQLLDVYVFGEGSSGELGLGSKAINGKKPIDVKRPRLNPKLDAKAVGVVQVACGGMHVAVLTKDNKILTWGVNDSGALGRDTKWDGGLRDMKAGGDGDTDSDSDSDNGDTEMNPLESTPTTVDDQNFAKGAKFVQVVASDSATFVLTEDGRVYGWGNFRGSEGTLGFSPTVEYQKKPAFIPELKGIKSLAAGANHILALDNKGHIWAWGCGQQNQLGRRVIERNNLASLIPGGLGLPRKKFTKIACGQYHSFAVDSQGQVWTWGLNAFGGTGIAEGAGEDAAVVLRPALVEALADYNIVDIDGGQHHSLACSQEGELLTWGRFDGYQVGLDESEIESEEDLIRDESNRPRILAVPTVVPTPSNVVCVAAGTDNSFAITSDGKAYSWGFNSNYQGGQGHFDDLPKPTFIDNTATRTKKLVAAGAGGQFSVICGLHGVETDTA